MALDVIGAAPSAPLAPVLLASEPTLEGLHKLLAVGHPSVGVFSAEGGQFVGGHAMSEDAKLRSAAGFSCLWDGTVIQRVRSADGTIVLPGRRVCLHLMAQPEVCAAFLADRVLTDQGLLSRVLVTAPATTMGLRLWREPPAQARTTLIAYNTRLLSILEAPLPLAPDERVELAPRRLPLAPDARELWVRYADHVERSLADGGAYESIRGMANKLPEHAARLAAIMELVDHLEAPMLTADRMARGIALADHYADEALRLHAIGATDPTLLLAQRALRWCQAQPGGLVALTELYRTGPRKIRDAKIARQVVSILVEHGWLVEIPEGAEIGGQHRREVWRVREADQ